LITAIIPAAGLSTRMGGHVPKPLLPWGAGTVVEHVVSTLLAAGIGDVVVVTGHRREALEAVLAPYPVRCVFNPAYASGEMLSSLQAGLHAVAPGSSGVLLALADQPHVEAEIVAQVLHAFDASNGRAIVAPSYRQRRGHPILLPRWLWQDILDLPPGDTLRSVINRHAAAIRYLLVDTPTVLADMDTPEQYREALDARDP
jgi:molybdenum cofactor cytidylyltransferase